MTTTVALRPATRADAEACGRVCYLAFKSVAQTHNFPSDWPSLEAATASMEAILSHPGFYGVVAEDAGGRILGSCFLDERAVVAGLGPITVDPGYEGASLGRNLMVHVLERAETQGWKGVRLVQAAYNNRSLSLYAKLGFEVREPLSVMQGSAIQIPVAGHTVRMAERRDLVACNELCSAIHGYDRSRELGEAIQNTAARVAETEGRIRAYTTMVGFRGHTVGTSNMAIQALIAEASRFPGTGFLLPTRNGDLFRWCLQHGLRVVQQMTYMSRGFYKEARGRFLPSILA